MLRVAGFDDVKNAPPPPVIITNVSNKFEVTVPLEGCDDPIPALRSVARLTRSAYGPKDSIRDALPEDVTEPLLLATVEHDITGGFTSAAPLTLGARTARDPQNFHGAIDDVRLSSAALAPAQLLYTSEGTAATTLGYWRFEQKPDVFADASGHGHALERATAPKPGHGDPAHAALGDFCQALLNASEFLYVE